MSNEPFRVSFSDNREIHEDFKVSLVYIYTIMNGPNDFENIISTFINTSRDFISSLMCPTPPPEVVGVNHSTVWELQHPKLSISARVEK